MAIITTYTDDTVTTEDDKFLTVNSDGSTRLTPASTLKTYMESNVTAGSIGTVDLADDAVTAPKVDFGGSGVGIWWEEIGRTTLSGVGDTMTITTMTAKKHLYIIVNALATGGTIGTTIRFNNDSATNYARRISDEGGADATGVSQTGINIGTTGAWNQYAEIRVTNTTSAEKVLFGHNTGVNAAGAGSIPRRQELSGKWANTAAQITRVDVVNVGAGDFAIGSEVIVLGHD